MARKNEPALSAQEETVLCSCNLSAKVKIRTDRGLENVCMGCYYKHHYRQSVEYSEALGLSDTASRIAWLKQHAKGITQRYTRNIPATREPGEDWEEDAA